MKVKNHIDINICFFIKFTNFVAHHYLGTKNYNKMGKGDKKTKRGKIVNKSYGVKRPRKLRKVEIEALKAVAKSKKEEVKTKEKKVKETKVEEVVAETVEEETQKKAPTKKAAEKKEVTKKPAAKKTPAKKPAAKKEEKTK